MGLLEKLKTWFHELSYYPLKAIANYEFISSDEEWSYRWAKEADIPELLAVERNVFEDTPWTYSNFKMEIVDNHQAAFIVALDNRKASQNDEEASEDKIIGYIGFRWEHFAKDLHISNFVVKKELQGLGIGDQLFRFTEEVAEYLEAERISLEVYQINHPAQAFYRKRRFETIKIMKNYYSDGSNALLMEKDLRKL